MVVWYALGTGPNNTPSPEKVTRSLAAVMALLLLGAPRAHAQRSDSVPALRALRLRSDTLRIGPPAPYVGARRVALPGEAAASAAAWEAALRAWLTRREEGRLRATAPGDTAAAAPPVAAEPAREPEPQAAPTAEGVLARYAELGIQLNALFDLRFERLRNLRCTASDAGLLGTQCRGGFNPPTVEPQFGVRTGGVVGQRVHVNVDYDTQREFDASNNIQVFYQGLEDEMLQRVEVGNVTFRPPASRFITGGIPSNNFGVAARGQFGALELGGIYAQQKGNVVRSRIFTVGDQTVQAVDRFAADRDFEPQRFFFVRDPRSLPGYPALDVLNFNVAGLPDSIRIAQLRIYRNRQVIGRSTQETSLSGIRAVALRTDSPQRAGPVSWEALVEGRDYYLDPSGLWFALAARIDQDDFLAVSYVTADGDTTGTFPSAASAGVVDTLELIYAPRVGPDVPTFFYEMRNIYRVGAVNDIVRGTVQVRPVVGGSERPAAGAPTFLALLGLAQSSDATTFDEYNRLFPRQRDPGQGAPLRDHFIVFPHLTPFADSVALPAQYRTDSLYRTPTYLLRTQGPSPLFQLGLRYDARGGDDGTLQLGGFQIRQGSERVTVGSRTLVRDVDYTINYEIGQVTFTNADDLFRQPTQVAVQFEENAAFAIAPTSILGFTGRYDLGDHGSLTALGLWQRQRTTFTRPVLGFEPASNLVAGLIGAFRFEPLRLTRLLDGLPLVRTETPSLVTLDAEIATSRPSPNQVGVAYVESFEGEAGQFLSLSENNWEFGSRPSSALGLAGSGLDPGLGFQDDDAVVLTWQNLIAGSANQVVQVFSQEIDPSIVLQGAGQTAETVLWMALQPDTLGGLLDPRTFQPRWLLPHVPGPRWRSVATPLSATGVDLSRVEFLEFWVLEDDRGSLRASAPSLVFDIGTVYEDAVDFRPTSFTTPQPGDTVYAGRARAGEGRLDTERDTLTATFNAQLDDNGILGDVVDTITNATTGTLERDVSLCRSLQGQGLVVYSWGSLEAHCTRRNGAMDTEDLDNDQHLDTLIVAQGEDHFRYVVRIGDPRYLVRSGGTVPGAGTWQLYRVPFRTDTVQVGAPNIRQMRALRLTVVAPAVAAESTITLALARMRLVGAPWVKRAATPILGIGGQRGEPHGEVVASVVTTENRTDLGYEPPPGVVDQGQGIGGGVQLGTTQINEKSLRLIANDLRPGERAEAFYRFPEGDRNFLGYRQLRVWARGRGTGWETGELRFFIKVGQNEDNFYLYRTGARSTTWEPEVTVDFDRWFALRALIEQRFLAGLPPSGGAACQADTLAYVACDGAYLVQVRNPLVSPPNLTRVQEMAVGMLRDSGSSADSVELWVDDVRLTQVEDTPGWAGAVSLNVTAADIATINVGAQRRDGNFRQLGENPSYVTTNNLFVAATVRLERLGLDRLGLIAPFSVRTDRSTQDPAFLTGTDVTAAGLPDLRTPEIRNTSYSLSLRRGRRGDQWWQRAFTDNIALAGTWASGGTRSELATATSHLSDVRADYQVGPGEVGFRWMPGFLRDALDGLPAGIRNGQLVRGLREGRFRASPTRLTFSSGVTRTNSDRASYRVPIVTPFDSAQPVSSTTAAFRTAAAMELRPFASMGIGLQAAWDRDLKDYGDSTSVAAVASASRQALLGMNVGFLRQHSMGSRLTWAPPILSWLRPRFAWTSGFQLSRDPNAAEVERTEGDSAGAFRLPSTFGNSATTEWTVPVDVSRALRTVLGDSSTARRILDRVNQLEWSTRRERRSQFDRPGFDPGLGYRLGFGGIGGFLSQRDEDARSASEAVQDRLTTGLRLPLSLTITGTYGWRESNTWQLRGTRQQRQRNTELDWPNLQGRWLWNPGNPGLRRVVTTINATLGLQRRSSISEVLPLGGAATGGLRFSTFTRSSPASLSISWAPGVTTAAAYGKERTETDRLGSVTFGDRRNVSADIRFAFRTPQEIVPLRNAVRTSLRWSSAVSSTCVQQAGLPTCLRIADSRRTEYNLTMDTDMPPNTNAGLAVGYVLADDRHLNRKTAQFTLTATVRVFFQAGEIR